MEEVLHWLAGMVLGAAAAVATRPARATKMAEEREKNIVNECGVVVVGLLRCEREKVNWAVRLEKAD
jgi:hypothetical protein